jgi:hypothetical protein
MLHFGATSVMYSTNVKIGCVRKVRRRMQHKFQDVAVPNRKTIPAVEHKLRQTKSLLDKEN